MQAMYYSFFDTSLPYMYRSISHVLVLFTENFFLAYNWYDIVFDTESYAQYLSGMCSSYLDQQ